VGFNEQNQVIRFTPTDSLGNGLTETFPDTLDFGELGINDQGTFAAVRNISKGRYQGRYAIRVDSSGIIEWQAPYFGSSGSGQGNRMLTFDCGTMFAAWALRVKGL
jgi:hypothetical protein